MAQSEIQQYLQCMVSEVTNKNIRNRLKKYISHMCVKINSNLTSKDKHQKFLHRLC